MTVANLIKYENTRLRYVRKWLYVQAALLSVYQVQIFLRKDVVFAPWLKAIDTI